MTTLKQRFEEQFGNFSTNVNKKSLTSNAILTFIESEQALLKERERAICRQIFIDEVDWSEWGVSAKEAGETFDEALTIIKETE